jgi:hypothetical protein
MYDLFNDSVGSTNILVEPAVLISDRPRSYWNVGIHLSDYTIHISEDCDLNTEISWEISVQIIMPMHILCNQNVKHRHHFCLTNYFKMSLSLNSKKN